MAAHTVTSHDEEFQPAEEVELVQQHTVFVELIVEEVDDEDDEDVDSFGAVVGLIKECEMRDAGMFDNAVLWLNDQFLFGAKEDKKERNPMGINPNRTHDSVQGEDGFVHENRSSEGDLIERWGGCWIPVGFAHAVQANGNDVDVAREAIEQDNREISTCEDRTTFGPAVEEELEGDEREQVCEAEGDAGRPLENAQDPGSICDYDSSYYVTDPNGFRWVIDRTECDGVEGLVYTGHLQVDPATLQGIADRADWAYTDGTLRQGVPIAGPNDDIWDECKEAGPLGPDKCTIEYSFLLAIALDDHPNGVDAEHCPEEDPRVADRNWALEGESHPHSAGEDDCGPEHTHPTGQFDIFFHDKAPFFVMDNPYWDNAHSEASTHGTPPEVTFGADPNTGNWDDCQPQTINADEPYQEDAINERDFEHPCDDVQTRGFHAHDGSQTTFDE